jgi:hypothetical protein
VTIVHLPAMNTAQFSWCRARLPRHPQPVPPIFEPEVGARAIYWAAHHSRREVFVGGPTVKAIYGQNLAPGYADWYLGTHGYEAQQTAQSIPRDRPDNLFQSVEGDFAAHGIFCADSKDYSLQNWINLRRMPVGLIVAGLAGLGAWIWRRNVFSR